MASGDESGGGEFRPAFLPHGPDGISITLGPRPDAPTLDRVRSVAGLLRDAPPEGCLEVLPALTSIRVRFDPSVTTRRHLTDRLEAALRGTGAPRAETRRWTVPVAFDPTNAPQLAEAARLAGQSEAEAVATITGTDLSVLAIGFAPGQPYLGLLPPSWDIPRQTDLTPRVPEGALVAAVRQLIIFGAATPTGWRQVGGTALRVFDPGRTEPFALRSGDVVRFSAADPAEIAALRTAPGGLGGARMEVLR